MKTPMHKTLALILALVLCLGVLAGCDTKPADETTKPAAQSTTAPAANDTTAPTEPEAYSFEGKTLDVYAGHAANMPGTPLDGFIKETLGINIEWKTVGEAGVEALLTEKVTPSLLFTTGGLGSGYTTYGRYGAYVNFWDYQELMPNFFALFNDESDPTMVAYKQTYMASEDELYVIPVFLNGDVQRSAWIYRDDIFKELNLEVPTDWDSFVEVLRAIKKAYPDSYPFTMRASGGIFNDISEFANQFGVNYSANAAVDPGTTNYYDPATTDEMRNMIKCIRQLIDEGLMNVACLGYDTAMWMEAMAKGESMITYTKAFQLQNMENAGIQANPDFSLNWFNNIELFDNPTVPHENRPNTVQSYAWYATTKCADLELALRYLDWMYSEEGMNLMSWGIEGQSYTVDANGNKAYIEGFDKTYMARYQESGLIDFAATLAGYPHEKTQAMILDTMAAAQAGGWEKTKVTLGWSTDEQLIIDTYHQGWVDDKKAGIAKFMLGEWDIDDDTAWQNFKDTLAAYHVDELLACYDAAHARATAK